MILKEEQSEEEQATASSSNEQVRILHISDTHSMHRQIETEFGRLPDPDILVHTGDFTNSGRQQEFEGFNAWLGELRERGSFEHIVVITGNHEWKLVKNPDGSTDSDALIELASRADYATGLQQLLLCNATVLGHQVVELFGIRLFGSAWCPWQNSGNPDRVIRNDACELALVPVRWQADGKSQVAGHENPIPFYEIPEQVNVLPTHGPAFGVSDQMKGSSEHWGGSEALRRRVEQVASTMYLFGHLHEQRGVWWREQLGSGVHQGGVEYVEVNIGRGLPPPPCTRAK